MHANQSHYFFLGGVLVSETDAKIFGFLPVLVRARGGLPPVPQKVLVKVSLNEDTKTFPLIPVIIKYVQNKKKGKSVDNFLIPSVYATSQLTLSFFSKIFGRNQNNYITFTKV